MRPLRYILRKLGLVKLEEVEPPAIVLPAYSFMFRTAPPPVPVACAEGSTELPLPHRLRLGSEPAPIAAKPYPAAAPHPVAAPFSAYVQERPRGVPPPLPPHLRAGFGLDYSDGETQIMEAPTVQPLPSFMGLKRRG